MTGGGSFVFFARVVGEATSSFPDAELARRGRDLLGVVLVRAPEREARVRRVGGTRGASGQSVSEPRTVVLRTVELTASLSPVRFHELGATITSCWWLTSAVTGSAHPRDPFGCSP